MVRAAVQIVSGATLLVLALIAYATYAERSAEKKARSFCSDVKIGDRVDRLLESAKWSGADERHTRWLQVPNEDRLLPVTFTGFTPISRHTCSVRASENVTSASYVYFD